jgi:acetyl-CoA synthetase
VRAYRYATLDGAASRFADGLRREGVQPGETVAVLAGRVPELLVAVLGTLRAGAVATVLFASYGPEPVQRRLARGGARLLVTTEPLFRAKVEAGLDDLPHLRRVLLVEHPGTLEGDGDLPEDDLLASFGPWLAAGDPSVPDAPVTPDTPALLHFTSGTTGDPKGVVHVHDAVRMHRFTGEAVLGLEDGTRYWCTADPGWVTGMSYGILAPLAAGCTLFQDQEEFSAERWHHNLAAEGIEVLYTAPTALRFLRLMHRPGGGRELPALRGIFSVGEPLASAEADWARETLGAPVRDTWWQTETGCIVVATPWDEDPRPGRIGRPVDGFEVACLPSAEEGGSREPAGPGVAGELAVRAPWPSMFRAYLDRPDLYRRCFEDGWYLSGDVAIRDEEGWIEYVGRKDDLFNTAGHLVGPAEVEGTLVQHPAVADAAVTGRPDPVAGTVIEAWVVLDDAHAPSAEEGEEGRERVVRDVLRFARERLGPALAPRTLHLREDLPRTPSGKIVRRALEST